MSNTGNLQGKRAVKLKDLQKRGLITRKQFNVVPPKMNTAWLRAAGRWCRS